VNRAHLEFCSSPEWARLVEDELLPWVLDGRELGDELLEVGPGPGLTTDVLRRKAPRVTAVELDLALAEKLAARLASSNVRVIAGDVTRLPFPAGQFSGAACLTMLHHIPSPALQDAALAELAGCSGPAGCWPAWTGWTRRPGGSCTKTTCSSRSTPARWRADCTRRGSAVPRSTWPVTGSGSRRPVDVGRPLVGAGLHRGAVEELVVAGNPAAGGDRLGPALGQRAD
jgi:SAM-dependent methyltransferase